MLSDDYLIAIFDRFLDETWEAPPIKPGRDVAITFVDSGKALYWITTSPGSATDINQNSCEGHARRLVRLASLHRSLVPTSDTDIILAVLDRNHHIY